MCKRGLRGWTKESLDMRLRRYLLTALAVLLAGCSFGPKHLQDGHLAYNEAVRASSDKELLLNIVRIRYLDTIEFLSVNSISAQLSFSVAVGGRAGTEFNETTAIGFGDVAWSNRPTFTFTPQRGADFASKMITPVPMPILIELAAADWHAEVLFRLLVQNVNGLANMAGLVDDDFLEVTRLLAGLQNKGDLYFGAIEDHVMLSDPIAAFQVSGSDLVEAAKQGYRFERDSSGKNFVLTDIQTQPVLHVPRGEAESARLFELLRLRTPKGTYVELFAGTKPEDITGASDRIAIDTRSVLDTIAFLAGGVEVPSSHLDNGWTWRDWPIPGIENKGLPGLIRIRSSANRPKDLLAVRHRDHWFYLADDDAESRMTFLLLAEILRMALSPGEGQSPVLTLPVGGR